MLASLAGKDLAQLDAIGCRRGSSVVSENEPLDYFPLFLTVVSSSGLFESPRQRDRCLRDPSFTPGKRAPHPPSPRQPDVVLGPLEDRDCPLGNLVGLRVTRGRVAEHRDQCARQLDVELKPLIIARV